MTTNTAVISPFPHTPILQENEEKEQEKTVVSTTTRTRARARIEAFLDEVEPYYCETFGAAALPPVAKSRITMCIQQGMAESLIYTAIDAAAMAPRPSWAYANAILMRLQQEECLTPEAYEQRQARHRARWKRAEELPF